MFPCENISARSSALCGNGSISDYQLLWLLVKAVESLLETHHQRQAEEREPLRAQLDVEEGRRN